MQIQMQMVKKVIDLEYELMASLHVFLRK